MRSIVTTVLLLGVISGAASAAKPVTSSMPVSMRVTTGATVSARLVGSQPVVFDDTSGAGTPSRHLGRPLFSVSFERGERGTAHPQAVWDPRTHLLTLHF